MQFIHKVYFIHTHTIVYAKFREKKTESILTQFFLHLCMQELFDKFMKNAYYENY